MDKLELGNQMYNMLKNQPVQTKFFYIKSVFGNLSYNPSFFGAPTQKQKLIPCFPLELVKTPL